MGNGDYRTLLLSELQQRKSKNPLYSIRAFARDLGIGSTSLSDVLAYRRHLSKKNALRIAERLALSPKLVERLLLEIRDQEAAQAEPFHFIQIQEDEFRLISDWHYFAILSLARLKANKSDPEWIAQRLGLEVMEARDALARLVRMGFITEQKGRMIRTAAPIRTTTDVPSSALRNHHRQNLRRAERALDEIPMELREISSTTFAIDSSKLGEAKDMIVRFKRKFSKQVSSANPDEVYTLALQFFPATKPQGKKK